MKKVELNPKDQRIAQARLKGAKLKDIAKDEYPNAKPRSGEVLVSRQLQKPNVAKYIEQEKGIALKNYGFTWDRIIGKLNSKIDATKSDFHTGELIDDNPTQMAALKIVISLLEVKQIDEETRQTIANLPTNASDVDLVMFLKKRSL